MAKKSTPRAAGTPAQPAPSLKPTTPTAPRPRAATKGAILGALSEQTGLARNDVARVFDALHELIARELSKKGPGQFVVPGLLKLKVVRKPATKAKSGVNPFTKEPMTIQAKPARNVIKAVPMKGLKELV
jgi:nucleoid DNA-binding protein